MSDDLGGDPACWAHLFDEERDEAPGGGTARAVVCDLGSVDLGLGDTKAGAVWSLPHGGDLDVNLVHLEPGGRIGAHVFDDVDVLIVVLSVQGELAVDGVVHRLAVDTLAHVPRGAARWLCADADGLTYLSVHRRRSPLGISHRAKRHRQG
jgi:quercetin dioxygenase-like cupin family protein